MCQNKINSNFSVEIEPKKKKVLLISALMQNPKILLLDEPFTGLHKEAISSLQSLIKETLKKTNTLVICVDHHATESKDFYDFELRLESKALKIIEHVNLRIPK